MGDYQSNSTGEPLRPLGRQRQAERLIGCRSHLRLLFSVDRRWDVVAMSAPERGLIVPGRGDLRR